MIGQLTSKELGILYLQLQYSDIMEQINLIRMNKESILQHQSTNDHKSLYVA